MAFKPNYNQQRAERNRAKQAKQEAKRLEQEEQKAKRRQLEQSGGIDVTADPAGDAPSDTSQDVAAEPSSGA